ncbi:MAG: UDP-2,3-diacylglucosamine hydrolase [Verrucomicrobiae bacterium]|nr:UDP-2,3-diacylglucosamine hydrolase [Verrucomicrobiae bacterium]
MKYRTVWLSDMHLGTRGCDALGLLEFLRETECDRLYLVGDVIDLWRLRREHYWPQTHNDVVQKILRKARKGTDVVLIPGNHDEFVGNFLGIFGNIVIKKQDVYTTGDGRRLLIMHGHEFDAVTTHAQWLAYLGDIGYGMLLAVNRPLNLVRSRLGLQYWSLSAFAKSRVKNAVNFISHFEEAVAHYAQLHHADGIVCGHIHTPAIKPLRGITYYNTGDWVESSTALVEHFDGRIELVRWRDRQQPLPVALDVQDQSALLVTAS